MRLLFAAALLALAGCATPEQLPSAVGSASDQQLCEAMVVGPADKANIAQVEARLRKLDCAPYMDAIELKKSKVLR